MNSDDSGAMVLVMLMGLVFLALYFLPGIVARVRNHHQVNAIFLLNLFLGWTFVGWVVALVWAATAVQAAPAAPRPSTPPPLPEPEARPVTERREPRPWWKER